MREISASRITEEVAKLCISANYNLGDDIYALFKDGMQNEKSPVGRDVFSQLIKNADIAYTEQVPMCQDTGFVVAFIDIGQDVHITEGLLVDAVNAGVSKGYTEGYLRKSIVSHPIQRINTNDNTPAVIHTNIVPGDKLKIVIAPKGGGSENMSSLCMLKPSDGVDGVKKFVVDVVKSAGPNPCPPIIVGVGIGGTMEKAAILAKKSLLRRVGEHSSNSIDTQLEIELLELINKTGIGPSGLGGSITTLAVNVESFPCHIASLPVAVNIQCHAARHKEVVL